VVERELVGEDRDDCAHSEHREETSLRENSPGEAKGKEGARTIEGSNNENNGQLECAMTRVMAAATCRW
jgi:hypothetical protein